MRVIINFMSYFMELIRFFNAIQELFYCRLTHKFTMKSLIENRSHFRHTQIDVESCYSQNKQSSYGKCHPVGICK